MLKTEKFSDKLEKPLSTLEDFIKDSLRLEKIKGRIKNTPIKTKPKPDINKRLRKCDYPF